jgi:TldD protein
VPIPTTDPRTDDLGDLPLDAVTDAALSRARELGAVHADVRVERIASRALRLSDGRVQTAHTGEDVGLAVRVVVAAGAHHSTWGFAAGTDVSADAAARLASAAVDVAAVTAPVNTEPVELADEPVHQGTWISSYAVDPLDVPERDQVGLLAELSGRLLRADGVRHADASMLAVKEVKFYADLAGTRTAQRRVRMQAELQAMWIDDESGRCESMRTLAPPAGRGWEWMTGGDGCWDWDREIAELPGLLLEKATAPSVAAGTYALVIDPSNLWLTIHGSIGHATERDRALGYEANYAGTTFATFDRLGNLQYGSPVMHVTGDRTAEHGLATVGWDDDGVAAQTWDLVRDGVLVGYQLDRRMARLQGLGRSNGCAFADAPHHMPLQRMANVSLQPAAGGPSTDELIAGVDDGIYVVGDNSWSIDMQRYNFQFTGQRFYRIRDGHLAGQLRDVAYQANTVDFWNAMDAVGGPQTYVLGGAFNCGKGQPAQVAPVSHGCPTARFRGIRVLNTTAEGHR